MPAPIQDLKEAIYLRLDSAGLTADDGTDLTVSTTARDAGGELIQLPYLRIEQPVVADTVYNGTGAMYDVSVTLNAFSQAPHTDEVGRIIEEASEAVMQSPLQLAGGHVNIQKETRSVGLTERDSDRAAQVHQRSAEFACLIS